MMAKMKHPRRAGWMKTMMQNRDRMRLLWVCLGFVVLLFVVKWYTTGFQELLPGEDASMLVPFLIVMYEVGLVVWDVD